jgi:hypothetical protein
VPTAGLRQRQRINQKLPQAPESVLEQVWTILNAANEDEELYAEFDSLIETLCERWEAASDEDEFPSSN